VVLVPASSEGQLSQTYHKHPSFPAGNPPCRPQEGVFVDCGNSAEPILGEIALQYYAATMNTCDVFHHTFFWGILSLVLSCSLVSSFREVNCSSIDLSYSVTVDFNSGLEAVPMIVSLAMKDITNSQTNN